MCRVTPSTKSSSSSSKGLTKSNSSKSLTKSGSIRSLTKSNSSGSNINNNMSSSSKPKKQSKPAFDGANFDKDGNCVKHKSIQLAEQVKQDGRLLWKEIKMVSSAVIDDAHT